MNKTVGTEARRIADEIVALVERMDGPVTLYKVQREVKGFGASKPPYRDFYIQQTTRPAVVWADMSEAAVEALKRVMLGHRVAVEMVDALPYIIEGVGLRNDDWQPVVLLPAKSANISTKNGLFRVPEKLLTPEHMLPSWEVLSEPTRATAH